MQEYPFEVRLALGPYIISNKYFLGQPIIDACIDEKKCNWSGAILCDSAVEAMKKQDYRPIDWMGINVRPFNPFTSELIIKFPANSTSFNKSRFIIQIEFRSLESFFCSSLG